LSKRGNGRGKEKEVQERKTRGREARNNFVIE